MRADERFFRGVRSANLAVNIAFGWVFLLLFDAALTLTGESWTEMRANTRAEMSRIWRQRHRFPR